MKLDRPDMSGEFDRIDNFMINDNFNNQIMKVARADVGELEQKHDKRH